MPSANAVAMRVSLVYFAYFFFLGINTVYAPSWLSARGFGLYVGAMLSASLIAKTIGQPVLSYLAEHWGRRAMLILASLVAVLSTLVLVFTHNYFSVLMLLIIAGFFIGPILPLSDVVALTNEDINYGRVRLWGSIGFFVANIGGGTVKDIFGVTSVIWIEVIGLLVLLLVTFSLPHRSHASDESHTPAARAIANKMLGKFLLSPVTWLFILSIATLNASHAFYYAFSTLYWQSAQHFTGLQVGLLWATGVVAEVALLAYFGDHLPMRRAKQLMIFAGFGGVIRWSITALAPGFALLFPLQLLHALTYAAMHLGAMLVLRRAVPAQIASTVMGIYAAMVNGVIIGIVTGQLDPVYKMLGAHGYFIMAGLSALGGLGIIIFTRLWDGDYFAKALETRS